MTTAHFKVIAYPASQREVLLTTAFCTGTRADHMRMAAQLRDRFPCADRIVCLAGPMSFIVFLGGAA